MNDGAAPGGHAPGRWHSKVAGFEVEFPHKPYGVQLAFMNQVLRAIDHDENALLEAPTGCGKTCVSWIARWLHASQSCMTPA